MEQYNFKYGTVPLVKQAEAFYQVYGKYYFALLCSPGTGKTKILIDIAVNLYLEGKINAVLVIAPNGVQIQWDEEQLPDHLPTDIDYISMVWDSTQSKSYARDLYKFISYKTKALKWFFINTDAFSMTVNRNRAIPIVKDFLTHNDTLLCLDESSKIKNPDTGWTVNLLNHINDVEYARDNKTIIRSTNLAKYRAILTGTVITNSPANAWSQFEFLQPGFFDNRDYIAFKTRYMIEVKQYEPVHHKAYYRAIRKDEIVSVRRYIAEGLDDETISTTMDITESAVRYLRKYPSCNTPYKNMNELMNKIRTVSAIVKKEEMFDFPEKQQTNVYCEFSAKQKELYKDTCDELYAIYADTVLEVHVKLALITRLRQITGGFFPGVDYIGNKTVTEIEGNAKMVCLLEDLEQCDEWPCIIACEYVDELLAIERNIKKEFSDKNVAVIYGKVPNDERADIRKTFKTGEIDILIANPPTIGIGFNLQRAGMIEMYSSSYNYEQRLQLEDRIHRIGMGNKAVYRNIRVRKTIDDRIYESLALKSDLLNYTYNRPLRFITGEV